MQGGQTLRCGACYLVLILFLGIATPREAKSQNRYRRDAIGASRFGDNARQALIKKIYSLDSDISKNVFGQNLAARSLRDRLIQYIEGFGSRTKEPVALNLIGLPGIGKSAIVNYLDTLGIQVLHFDAQTYAKDRDFAYDVRTAYNNLADKNAPFLLIIEELDKVAEIKPNGEESTYNLIGVLNEILSEGKLSAQYGGARENFAGAMVLTTMNLSPREIAEFSQEALGEKKSFYDFSVADFAKFHEWILDESSALPKILSRLFRSNTVSRLSPNTILLKPLDESDFRHITEGIVQKVIARTTQGKAESSRLEVTYSHDLVDFITAETSYAPSGARNTVTKADVLAEQLINFGKRATTPGDESLNQPRKISLSFDKPSSRVKIEITPRTFTNGSGMRDGVPFTILVDYSRETGVFIQPPELALDAPAKTSKGPIDNLTFTKKQIREARFPKKLNLVKNLEKTLNSLIFGQEQFTRVITQEMNNYLARPQGLAKTPAGVVFAGFPGIGKTDIVMQTANYLQLPIIRINLQQFSTNEAATTSNFLSVIDQQINKVKGQKFILLLEELDKVFEIDPKTGMVINRPVMGLIKDLLNDGRASASFVSSYGSTIEKSVDVRDSFLAVTMNFAVDRFSFEADPRLTTINDVQEAWRRLSTRVSDLKSILGTMFLPETVNRLLAKMNILKPLGEDDYKLLIDKQIGETVKSRFFNKEGADVAQIEVTMTPAYKKYLFDESVIPSEGARHTVNSVKTLVSDDLEMMLKKIPKNPKFSGEKLIFSLDYLPASQKVRGSISVKDKPSLIEKNVYQREVSLLFPPLGAKGKMPPERFITSIHEFGHAFVTTRLGARFEFVSVVPPKGGIGGYVKYTDGARTASSIITRIYSALGARAMERIFLSETPNADSSVLDITRGASNDIMQATAALFELIYQLGFDPGGGTLEGMGVSGGGRYANFSDLPSSEVAKIGRILRNMENHIVEDLLKAHDLAWYTEKVKVLARKGGMSEKDFYDLVDYKYPGETKHIPGEELRIYNLFKGQIQETPKEVATARNAKKSKDELTVRERRQAFDSYFGKNVKQQLHFAGRKTCAEVVKQP